MPTIIRFSEAASIALHTMRLLAAESEDRLTTRGMARTLGVSETHLSKVLQRLVRRGFVASTRGPKGGFALVGDPAAITLMSVYEAIDGPLSAETCFLGLDVCPLGGCMFGGLMETINDLARKQLEGTTLSDLVNGSGRGRRDGGGSTRG